RAVRPAPAPPRIPRGRSVRHRPAYRHPARRQLILHARKRPPPRARVPRRTAVAAPTRVRSAIAAGPFQAALFLALPFIFDIIIAFGGPEARPARPWGSCGARGRRTVFL